MSLTSRFFAAAAFLLGCGLLGAQTPAPAPAPTPAPTPAPATPTAPASTAPATDPPALVQLRQRYQALLLEAENGPRAQWAAALEAMEKQEVIEGDFETAAKIRARRLSLQPGAAAPAARSPITLSPATSKPGTGIDFADSKKEVARFRRTGGLLEWDLPGQAPGTYEVRIVFAVAGGTDLNDQPDPLTDPRVPLPPKSDAPTADQGAGGVVEFRKITNLKEGGTVLRRSVRPTGGWGVTKTLSMGNVELDGKIVKFSLRAVDAKTQGVMDFHRIELVPTGPAGQGDSAGVKEFARLREVYQKQFTDQTRPIDAKYLKGLTDLEAAAIRNQDNDAVALVRLEKKKLEASDSDAASAADSPAGVAGNFLLPVTEKLHMMIRGEAKLTNAGDYLTRMRPAKTCEVLWKLPGLGVPSGKYKVTLEARLSSIHGGSAVLQAGSTGGEAGPALRFEVKGTPPVTGKGGAVDPDFSKMSTPTTITLAPLVIPRGAQYLILRVESLANPNGGLFDLKSLNLTPLVP